MAEIRRHMHFRASKETAERLDNYILKITSRNGFVRHGLRSEILRRALNDWLDKNEKDLSIEF
ncbi:unnamed protein product [marine sediment metagenome]|uniref:Uncharacterized protein n=1 Tax=marine sediment metagenome TaxID=412755 RepID=X1FK32_9ZZZZ